MSEESLAATIKKLIVTELKLNREPESISETDNLFGGGLGLDSIDVLSLVTALEEKFDITIEDDDVQKLNSVSDIKNFIENKKG